MKRFADLYAAVDETTKTNEKVEAIAAYLRAATPADAVWAINFLIGRRPKRLIATRDLVGWAIEESGLPSWMFEESYHAVGDLAETIALLLPPPTTSTEHSLSHWVEERLLPMRGWDDAQRRASMIGGWRELDERQRFVWNKLITGEFRVGVSQNLVVRAIAKVSGLDPNVVAHRLMGDWQPTPEFHQQLFGADSSDADVSRPYPFCLAHPIEGDVEAIGNPKRLAGRVEVGRHPLAVNPP